MVNESVSNLAVWALLWGATWGFFFVYLQKKVDYVRFYLVTSLYFLAAGIISIFVFKEYVSAVIKDFSATSIIILGLVYLARIIFYYFFRKYVREPKEYLRQYPKRTYLLIDYRRLFSKSFDLLFQQVFIVLLALFLNEAGLSIG